MTWEEFERSWVYLINAYRAGLGDRVKGVYWEQLRNFSASAWSDAVRKVVSDYRTFPSAAALRDVCWDMEQWYRKRQEPSDARQIEQQQRGPDEKTALEVFNRCNVGEREWLKQRGLAPVNEQELMSVWKDRLKAYMVEVAGEVPVGKEV